MRTLLQITTVVINSFTPTRITSEETVEAKRAFEAHAETFGVKIKQCHADNGCCQDLEFKEL
jgi:hypothetical protein